MAAKDTWLAQQQANQRAGRRAARMRKLMQMGLYEPPRTKREARMEIEALSFGIKVKRYRMGASGSLWADAAARKAAESPLVVSARGFPPS